MMVISIEIQRKSRLRPKLRFGMIWIVPKMRQMQFVLENIFAENYAVIKLHGVKIYD